MKNLMLALGCLLFTAAAPSLSAQKQPPLSPPASTTQTLDGKTVTVTYSAPSVRGRKIFGGLVPYGVVWRTGANAATTLKTEMNLKIGGASVPAGTYTLYTLPSEQTWKLIISRQTGQWGTEYHPDRDLARVDMKRETLPSPQERMTITLDPFRGRTSALHIRWDTLDLSVPLTAE